MAVTITRGESDPGLEKFVNALEQFQQAHPDADINLYRHGKYSVRVRIVAPEFTGLSRVERHRRAWPYLAALPEGTLSDLSSLLLLSPDERPNSFASFEFDDPVTALI